MSVDVVKNDDGLREVHWHVHWWGRDAHVAILLQRLLFWAVLIMLVVPASAFQMMPRMPSLPAKAPTSQSVLAIPRRAHLLENITALQGTSATPAALLAASSNVEDSLALINTMSSEALSEDIEFGIDACLLDATTEEDFTACIQQMHSTSLDELSSIIVRESCDILNNADDGTIVGLLGQVLHTAKEEGLQAISLRRLALKACVSVSLHKLTVCAMPALTCMMHLAPDALHSLSSSIH